MYVDWRL